MIIPAVLKNLIRRTPYSRSFRRCVTLPSPSPAPAGYDDVDVRIEDISLVKPERPTKVPDSKDNLLYLSSLDLLWRGRGYSRRVLFYPARSSSNVNINDAIEARVEILKQSLGRALVYYFPAAGRLAENPVDGRTYIHCGDQGAEVVVASVNAPMTGLEASQFQLCPFYDKLARYSTYDIAHMYTMPLCSVQVTKFICGGITIAYSISHVVGDGQSIFDLVISWAQCARNEAISYVPIHNRIIFKVDKPSHQLATNYDPLDVVLAQDELSQCDTQMVFHVTPEFIVELKHEAGSSPKMSRPFSSYEVLCAHLWRKALPHFSDPNTITRFAVMANMRFRVNPPLPYSFFGNAIFNALAVTPFYTLHTQPLSTLALLIHDAALRCNEHNLWAFVHWLELHNNKLKSPIRLSRSYMDVAGSTRFNILRADFGWGCASAVRPARITTEGEIALLPNRVSGFDVCIALSNEVSERLVEECKHYKKEA